jgi:taurine transport system substrate-binding protein
MSCTKENDLPKEVRVGYYPGWPCTYQLGQAKGWFDEELGTKVVFKEFDTPSQIATAIVSGDLDLAYSMGAIPFTIGVSSKVPYTLIGIAVSYLENDNCVARNGSGVTTPKDLSGKKVGVPFGSTSHYNLLTIMKKSGIDPGTVEIYDMAPQDITAAMKRKDLDCGCAWEPAVSAMLEDGALLVDKEQKEDWGMKVFDIVVVGDKFSEKFPDLVTRFLSVVDRSTLYYREHPEESVPLIAEIAGLEPEQTGDILSKMKFLVRDEQLSSAWLGTSEQTGEAAEFLKRVALFLQEEGELENVLDDYSAAIDQQFYESVRRKSQ